MYVVEVIPLDEVISTHDFTAEVDKPKLAGTGFSNDDISYVKTIEPCKVSLYSTLMICAVLKLSHGTYLSF